MRYLVHSKRTGTQLTLGYDERGLLCEMLIEGAADAKGVEWLRLNSPVLEQEVMPAFQKIPGVTVRMITVDFAQFWRTYPRRRLSDHTIPYRRLSTGKIFYASPA